MVPREPLDSTGLMRGLLHRLRPRTAVETLKLPRRSSTSPAYAAAGHGGWVEVVPAGPVPRRPPIVHGDRPSSLLDTVATSYPALGVLVLEGGFVAGQVGWIVGADRTQLPDHAFHRDLEPWRGRLQRNTGRIHRVERLTGTCISIASFNSWHNYGHFLLESVPRLWLTEQAGFPVGDVDHVIASVPHRGARRLLERLGVREDQLVVPRPGVAYRPDTLIAPSFPGACRNSPPWSPPFLRERLGPGDVRPHRRLYVPRLRERRIVNLPELQPMLDAHGFETFDPGAAVDPIRGFAEAEVVVGAHGAGLADLAFCAPGTPVLEILPSEHQMPYYYTVAESAGLRYGYLVGRSVTESKTSETKRDKVDLEVDAAAFGLALDATVALIGSVGVVDAA